MADKVEVESVESEDAVATRAQAFAEALATLAAKTPGK